MEDNKHESVKLPQNIKHLPRRLQEKILRESEATNNEPHSSSSLSCLKQGSGNDSKTTGDSNELKANVEESNVGKQEAKLKHKSVRSRSQGKIVSEKPKLRCSTLQQDLEYQQDILVNGLSDRILCKLKNNISKQEKISSPSTGNVSGEISLIACEKQNKNGKKNTKSCSLEDLQVLPKIEIGINPRSPVAKKTSFSEFSRPTNDIKSQIVEKKVANGNGYWNSNPCNSKSNCKLTKKRCNFITENNHNRPAWFDVIYDLKEHSNRRDLVRSLVNLDNEYNSLLDDDIFLQKWENYMQLQRDLQDIFLNFLKKDLKFCCKENVELYFWKILYHNVIEILKKKMQRTNGEVEDEFIKNLAIEIINSGLKFYEKVLKMLQDEYSFDLLILSKTFSQIRKKDSKYQQMAIVSSQKILLNLGDLLRYKELINKTQNYDNARNCYTTAQKLLPTNGIPYNQLALLAIYSKKKFDSVYYHMRSLVASNPIHSAKESLKVLFDELRKKHEDSTKKLDNLKLSQKAEENKHRIPPAFMRREIWNHPNGSRRLHRMPSADLNSEEKSPLNDLSKLSAVEISKKFTSSFLYLHGKLFAGVGLENFYSSTSKMLLEFKHLLSHKPLLYSREKFVQIVTLNIFSIDFNNKEEVGSSRREVKNYAFALGFFMFGTMVHRLIELLRKKLNPECGSTGPTINLDSESETRSSNEIEIDRNVSILLSAMNVWCDWMKTNSDTWRTALSAQHEGFLDCQNEVDTWELFAQLTSVLDGTDFREDFFINSHVDAAIPIILEEEFLLDGFSPPLLSCDNRVYCMPKKIEAAKHLLRLKRVYEFGSKYLCESIPPIFKGVVGQNDRTYYTVAFSEFGKSETEDDAIEKFEELGDNVEDLERELLDIDLGAEEMEHNSKDNSEISELRKRKIELEKKHKMQEQYQQKLSHILSNSRISLHIEVHPKYLVPDTNCFIDFLDELKVVSRTDSFLLMIPLVVVNELEGLSKGVKPTTDLLGKQSDLTTEKTEHFLKVAEISKQSLEFIRSKNSSIRCVTTKGSVLVSSVFTSEDNNQDQTSNDDKILTTALSLCKIWNKEKRDDNVLRVKTPVVLLTTDRNLRVKALSRNLIVSQLPRFVEWAGLDAQNKNFLTI